MEDARTNIPKPRGLEVAFSIVKIQPRDTTQRPRFIFNIRISNQANERRLYFEQGHIDFSYDLGLTGNSAVTFNYKSITNVFRPATDVRELVGKVSNSKAIPENTSLVCLPPKGSLRKAVIDAMSGYVGDQVFCECNLVGSINRKEATSTIGVKKNEIINVVDALLTRSGLDEIEEYEVLSSISDTERLHVSGNHFYLVEREKLPNFQFTENSIGAILSDHVKRGIIVIDPNDDLDPASRFQMRWAKYATMLDQTWPQRFAQLAPRKIVPSVFDELDIGQIQVLLPNRFDQVLKDIGPLPDKPVAASGVVIPDMSDEALDAWWLRNVENPAKGIPNFYYP